MVVPHHVGRRRLLREILGAEFLGDWLPVDFVLGVLVSTVAIVHRWSFHEAPAPLVVGTLG